MSCWEWFTTGELERTYHDEEWGTPVHDDRRMFEHLSMEVMQCGLSFNLVLHRRQVLRECFDGFDPATVAAYTDEDVARIMATDGMIRAERKIRAIIGNAQRFREIQDEQRQRTGGGHDGFSHYLWSFTDGKTVVYQGHEDGRVPVSNRLSEKVSKDLKRRGFAYLGPVVMYSHLQACGIINDHAVGCPRRQYLIDHYPTVVRRRYGEKF